MSTDTVSPLRQRMMDDMNARKLGAHSQRSHISSCKRFAAFLKRSPDTATPDDVRRFQLHLAETGMSICNRNRIMTGVKFLFRITLRRPDLAAEIYHLREPQKIPQVMSQDETRRLLAVASSLRVLLSLAYGCGLRAGEPAAINATLYDKLNFNVIRDIAPVASIARAPNVMEVSLSVPVKTIPEFIAYAKAIRANSTWGPVALGVRLMCRANYSR